MALEKCNFSWSITNPRAASHTNPTLLLHHTLEFLRVMSITWKRAGANGWETTQVKVSKMCLNTHKKTLVFPELWSVHIGKRGGKNKVGKDGPADTICQNFQQLLAKGFYENPWENRKNHHRKILVKTQETEARSLWSFFAMAGRNWISTRFFPGSALSKMLKKQLENTKLFVVVTMSYL